MSFIAVWTCRYVSFSDCILVLISSSGDITVAAHTENRRFSCTVKIPKLRRLKKNWILYLYLSNSRRLANLGISSIKSSPWKLSFFSWCEIKDLEVAWSLKMKTAPTIYTQGDAHAVSCHFSQKYVLIRGGSHATVHIFGQMVSAKYDVYC